MIAAGLAATAGVAAAAPCAVRVARAPDGVRAVIERWVAAEADCEGALEVRIVEADGGLYVIAIDEAQHTYDRTVPDAESAGALIASWAAQPATQTLVPAAGARRVALAVAPEAQALYGLRPPSHDADEVAAVTAPRSPRPLWELGLELRVGTTADHAVRVVPTVRGRVDLWQRDRWTLGLGAGLAADRTTVDGGGGVAKMWAVHAAGYGAWTSAPSTWRLRAELGASVHHQRDTLYGTTFRSSFGFLEAAASVSRQVAPRWAIAAGPRLGMFVADTNAFEWIDLGLDAGLRGEL